MFRIIIFWKKFKHYFIPLWIKRKTALWSEPSRKKTLRKKIINFLNLNGSPNDKSLINYLSNNTLQIFPYDFIEKYSPVLIQVKWEDDFPYVIYEGKKLFFKRGMSEYQVMNAMNNLMIEQDSSSAHNYLKYCNKEKYGLIIDCGAAEGIFALKYIDNCKECIIVETDDDWIIALKKTFEPFSSRVCILGKFISDLDNEENITLDNLIGGRSVSLLKIDVDGNEKKLFSGALNSLSAAIIEQILLCVYHDVDDFKKYTEFLKKYGFKSETSSSKMLFLYGDNLREPYLTHGVVNFIK